MHMCMWTYPRYVHVCMSIYIDIWLDIHILYLYIYIYIYIYRSTYMYHCLLLHLYMYGWREMHVRTCAHNDGCIIYVYTYIPLYINIYIYIRIHIRSGVRSACNCGGAGRREYTRWQRAREATIGSEDSSAHREAPAGHIADVLSVCVFVYVYL